jgi:hypothetical protein
VGVSKPIELPSIFVVLWCALGPAVAVLASETLEVFSKDSHLFIGGTSCNLATRLSAEGWP